jgi:hypothetical protein
MVSLLGGELVSRAEDGSLEVLGIPLKKGPLARLMRKGWRAGVLYRCLKKSEYELVKLVIKLLDRVSSLLLARVLAPMIRKLLEALQGTPKLMIHVLGEVNYWMRKEGRSLAEKISRVAQRWGNKSAYKWPRDIGFIKYLTIMNLPRNKNPNSSFTGENDR